MEIKNQINIYHQGYKNKEQNPSSNPSFGQLNLQEYPKLAAAAITAAATGLMAVNVNKTQNNNNENLSFQNDLKKAIMIKPLDPNVGFSQYIENGAYSTVDEDLIKCIKNAEHNGISENAIFENMQQLHNNISNNEIESIANSFSDDGYDESVQLNVWFNLNDRKQLLQDLSNLRIQIPRTQNETIADYMKRLLEIREDNIVKAEEVRHKEVMSKINYDDKFIPTFEKIELTNEEIETAKKSLARDGVRLKDENSKEELSEHIIDNWVGGGGQYRFEDRAIQYAFQNLDNWASTDDKGNYTREPVYRWVGLYRNRGGRYDLFKMVREEMNPGQIYDAERIQSCSKNPEFAENEFGDFNPDKDLKLIIHPKSNISRAKDIGYRKYGGQEVVYMKGEKFKILDKRIVKFREPRIIYNRDTNEREEYMQTIFRYVIEMQEV